MAEWYLEIHFLAFAEIFRRQYEYLLSTGATDDRVASDCYRNRS